ncbi:MAG: hypothetical protein IM598_04370 [Chitinophagaceae bacterium]|nr:hypothetical protein [Microcystis sp. M27BS1]MCA6438652.1 hypothetical protein [Chitinophagaceae bacterium]MCA6460138.1 hypothetical protein [Chitinophagaceae bacterium]MCA6464038.1 hypothetical protein [Chitinophagaceae bacterium]
MTYNKRISSFLLFIVLVLTTIAGQTNSKEVLEWNSIKINNKLPLICKRSNLLDLLGKPDKILDPQSLDICTSYFEKDFDYLVWGRSRFESTNSQAVISSIDIESGKIKLVSPKITLDNFITLDKIKQIFPKATKDAEELIIDDKGKVVSIKLATSHKNSDDGWLLFFKAGKLVRVDYWIAC